MELSTIALIFVMIMLSVIAGYFLRGRLSTNDLISAQETIKKLRANQDELEAVICDLADKNNKAHQDLKTITAERNHWCIECDKAKANLFKVSRGVYSDAVVDPSGKIRK